MYSSAFKKEDGVKTTTAGILSMSSNDNPFAAALKFELNPNKQGGM